MANATTKTRAVHEKVAVYVCFASCALEKTKQRTINKQDTNKYRAMRRVTPAQQGGGKGVDARAGKRPEQEQEGG